MPKFGSFFFCTEIRNGKETDMDFKKIMEDYFGIILAVLLGVAVVIMWIGFTAPEGLIEGFTEDIMHLGMDELTELFE